MDDKEFQNILLKAKKAIKGLEKERKLQYELLDSTDDPKTRNKILKFIELLTVTIEYGKQLIFENEPVKFKVT